MSKYRFACGCEWEIVGPPPREGALPLIDIDYRRLPFCQATWDLLSRGETKGVFQLESQLGRQWTKRLKPRHAEHLSALAAILRPGTLRALDDKGVSMTEHYCRRANDEEDIDYYHDSLIPSLNSTYGVLCYQEQSMRIARELAGFDLKEADELRKGLGKKLPELIAKVRVKFLEGCKKVGVVNDEQANQIFDWIEKGNRYLFNRTHAVCYGLMGYDTAYIKAHIPVQFFASWLKYSQDKQDPKKEVAELISDAKVYDIKVNTPDIRWLEPHFWTDGVEIYFGLSDIIGVGESGIEKMVKIVKQGEEMLGTSLAQMTWYQFLTSCGASIPSSVMDRLICVGALSFFGVSRKRLLEEYKVWRELTDGEQAFAVKQNADDLVGALRALGETKKNGGGCHNVKRVDVVKSLLMKLENPPTSLEDTPAWIVTMESKYLGVPITYSRVDICDIGEANTTCREFLAGRSGKMFLGVEIKEVRVKKTKGGKTPGRDMAWLTIEDNTGRVESVTCFPDAYEAFGELIFDGNTVLIHGERDKKTDGLIVKNMFQM